jgi:hypothetical protein
VGSQWESARGDEACEEDHVLVRDRILRVSPPSISRTRERARWRRGGIHETAVEPRYNQETYVVLRSSNPTQLLLRNAPSSRAHEALRDVNRRDRRYTGSRSHSPQCGPCAACGGASGSGGRGGRGGRRHGFLVYTGVGVSTSKLKFAF